MSDASDRFELKVNPISRPRRRMFRRLPYGAVPGFAPICLDSNDPQTVSDAFSARLMRQIPTAKKELLTELEAFVKTQVALLPVVNPIDVDFSSWIESRKGYNEQRKQQLRDAYLALHGGPPTKRQRQHIDTFVKSEYYPCNKHARMINSRSDAFKAWAGPWIHAAENIVYSFYPEFIKHTPVPERPKKIADMAQAGRRYFATDFTAFESHFIPELQHAVENQLLLHLLRDNVYRQYIVDTNSGWNNMRTRSGHRARIQGRRMSGDLWTSLGNGFTNLMLAKFIAFKKGGCVDGFVEGDDGIFSSTVELTEKDYKDLGFTIKIEEVDDPCHASFCGMVFSQDYQIIRDPIKFLQGFGWTLSCINGTNATMLELLKAKSLSTLFETPSCPIVSLFAARALDHCGDVKPRFIDDGYHQPGRGSYVEPSLSTRQLFSDVYGISIDVQLKVEQLILDSKLEQVQEHICPPADVLTYSLRYLEVT